MTNLARDIERLTDRIVAARIILRTLVDARKHTGSDVKAVFEHASGGRLTCDYWRRYPTHDHAEIVRLGGINRSTGRSFAIRSTPFRDGQVDRIAAELAAVVLSQQDEGFIVPIDIPEFKIKGFSDAYAEATKALSEGRAAMGGVRDEGAALVKVCSTIASQMKNAREDLIFQATQLGNGGGSSDETSRTQSDSSEGQGD